MRTQTGYMIAVFLQDNRTFTTLIARPSADRRLAALRFPDLYAAATHAIPGLRDWVDEDRAVPITSVLPGGRLHNTYRGQLTGDDRVPLPGLVHVGDAVCTTNPTAGRGVALALRQAQRLVHDLTGHPDDPAAAAMAFDAWCTSQVRPWFDDHLDWDADLLRRWTGGDVDVTRRLPSDLILEAAAHEPALMAVAGPYMSMEALPGSLDRIEPRARELFASGWRPEPHPGPTREDLADLVMGAARPG